MAAEPVPITGEVLQWAIEQSGLSLDEAAAAFRVDADAVQSWLDGSSLPTVGELGRIAKALDRPRAFFLLPRPPAQQDVAAKFRRRPGSTDQTLSKIEIRRLRWVRSMQRLLSWIAERNGDRPIDVPELSLSDDPYRAGETERSRIGPTLSEQRRWSTPYDAVRAWTQTLDRAGVLVAQLDLGRSGLRGFSLWDERAPLIGINSSLRVQVRSYTVFHEYAHLLTRSDTACDVGVTANSEVERWCEAFAAGFLLPERELRRVIGDRKVTTVEEVQSQARLHSVSARAMAARLEEIDAAGPGLYQAVNAALGTSDWSDGGGGQGETSAEKRFRQLGARPIEMMLSAYDRGDVTLHDLETHLRLDGRGVDQMATLAREAG